MASVTIAVLVRNQFGVLNRVTSMFRRRRFNIQSLTVSETESVDFSRITIRFEGEKAERQQLIDQLYKLPDVCFIQELRDADSVSRELMLIKVKNDAAHRQDVKDAAEAFGAKVVDYTRESVMMQMTGSSQRIDAFIDLMSDYTILEICRTGIVSLERGGATIRKDID
ncbi:MAG: acetolactate synthase small subunit [Acutalibacteraceae bacterium]|jgi:acetolactate synthase-1/3 small subunit